MSTIVIRHCERCPIIREHAQSITVRLERDFDHFACIQYGEENEFSVLVDGVPILQRTDTCLPSIEEVEAAIHNAEATNDKNAMVPAGVATV